MADDDRRRWEDDRGRLQAPGGYAVGPRDADDRDHRGPPGVSYGRHYSEGGRYAGGAPFGGRGEDGYPLREPSRAPQESFSWRGDGPPPPRRDEARYDDRRDGDLRDDQEREGRRGFWSRMADDVRGRPRDDDGRRVERRRVEPQAFRDDDDRPDRFDVEIADGVAAKLGRDRRLDSRFIEIAVYHGEVELTGSVLSKDGRRRAKQLAEQVRGVRDVDNHLKVEPWRF